MKLLIALRSEMLKTKRTASFYFTLILAAIVPAILLLNLLTGGEDLAAIRQDPLNAMFALGMERNGMVFFPVFAILICTLLPQIEYRNNTWKQVFASPQSKGNVFLAKFLNVNLFIFLFLIANLAFISFVILATRLFNPTLDLLHHPLDITTLLTRVTTSYITMLGLCALQFWLGLRYRNFIIPTAIGFVLWITGMMMMLEFHSNLVNYFPYSIQLFPFISELQPKLGQVAFTSVGYAILFLLLGFLDFKKRKLTA